MIHNTKCTIRNVLLSIKEKYLLEGECAVEENNEEIFPDFAIENDMEYSIMSELVADAFIKL